MKKLGWIAVGVGLALCTVSGYAQQAAAPASGPVANPVTTMIKSQLPRFQKNMVGAADLMPPDKYSFKATPESTSFAHMVVHSLQANNHLCALISGGTAPDVKLADTDAKDKLVAGVEGLGGFTELLIEWTEIVSLVLDGNDNGQLHAQDPRDSCRWELSATRCTVSLLASARLVTRR